MAKEKVNVSKKKVSETSQQMSIANGTIESINNDMSREPENREISEKNPYSKKQKRYDKLTDWKNEPTFSQLKYDYDMAQPDHQEYLADLYRWRENLDGGKPIETAKNRSKVRPKLIKKQAEWRYPSLEEPFLSTEKLFNVRPRTFEDSFRAEQSEMYINYQWSVKIKKNKLVTDMIRNLVNEGTATIKSGWEIEEKDVEVLVDEPVYGSPEESFIMIQGLIQGGQISEEQGQQLLRSGSPVQIGTKKVKKLKTMLTKNQPVYLVCDNESIILDPTATRAEDLRFVIHEYDTDMAELKKEEFSEDTYIDDQTGERVTTKQGKYKNLDYITTTDKIDNTGQNSNVYRHKTQANFDSGDTRRKFKAYDYWGYWDINDDGILEPIVATWVGSVLIRLQKNPFPHKKIPFSFGAYIPVVGKIRGLPDGELLEENQDQIGKLTRAINDTIATQAVGQEFIDDQMFPSRVEKDNYNEGRTVYYRHGLDPKKAIYRRQVEPVDQTAIQMINIYNNEAESLSGTKSFSGTGIGSQAFGSVAQGIRSAMDAVSKREISVLRRISEDLITDIGRKTISMNQAYIDEVEMVRVTNNQFVPVKREDITGEFDLVCDVSTAEKDNETAQDLAMLAQTNAAVMDPEINKMIWAKILKLKKQPDLAQQILNYQPQPDPIAEQLKAMQLENAKMMNEKLKKECEEIDSRIHERVSRVLENEQDVGTKMANERLLGAQAEKVQAEADEINRQYIDNATGASRARELEDKEIDTQHNYEMEKMKMMNSNDRTAAKIQNK